MWWKGQGRGEAGIVLIWLEKDKSIEELNNDQWKRCMSSGCRRIDHDDLLTRNKIVIINVNVRPNANA
jgi:hypothetical protein